MNLRDIEYFVAVAKSGHFRIAAEECYVSQPTLSGQIKKLEEELGSSLFERNTRSVILTAFGEEALPIAKKILANVQELQSCAESLKDPYQGILKIGIFPTLGPWLFPRLSEPITEEFPHVQVHLLEEQSNYLIQKLQNGELDIAFLALPQDIPGMKEIPLFSESFWAAFPEKHSWSQKEEIYPDDLNGENMLLLNDGHCFRDQAIEICYRYGAEERKQFRATGIETLRQMVRMGSGITLIPRMAIPDFPEKGIRYKEVSGADFKRNIGLFYRTTHPKSLLIEDLAKLIKGICGIELPVKSI
ncbi:LysR substrate-binding domain-containing protein [Spirochaeta cellobiosiphila]|uniref:LysR substrate-binding domain-containing protein n=1 Tax=Spirochaeta cellobiosiphila TaxID=504483 RepID=UPI0004194586|nr:LysR substrate-binding domain-containing protein [Spirochaeta cellobiosiphila]